MGGRQPRTPREPRWPREPRAPRIARTPRNPRYPRTASTNEGMLRWGLALVISATLACIFGVWSILVAPFVGPTGFRLLDMLANDSHYKYLLIFLIPVTLYFVIINWWGLKIFRSQ